MRYVIALLVFSAQLFAVTNRIEIIIITPPEVLLSPGQTVQMHAYGYYSDGTVTDFTSKVTWSSIQSSIATVSSTGLVSMKGAGSALIKAAYSGYKGYGTVWNKFTPFIRVKPSTASFHNIQHIVFIVKENRSFDNYFGTCSRERMAPPQPRSPRAPQSISDTRRIRLPRHRSCLDMTRTSPLMVARWIALTSSSTAPSRETICA